MTLAALVAKRAMRFGDKGEAVRSAQMALRVHGHELVADGKFFGITERTVKDFQTSHRLAVHGRIDVLTAIELDAPVAARMPSLRDVAPLPSALNVAPWLSEMRAITGVKELAGGADSPIILGWVKEIVATYPDLRGTVGWYNHDSIPWCGLGMAVCMVRAGKRPPKLALGAINWLTDWTFGERLVEPCLGAVGIKSRDGGNHVFLYEGENATHYFGRGCNQSDQVNVSRIKKDGSVRGWMWARGEPRPQGARLITSFADAVVGTEA